jgi:hypothetical protein
MQVTTAPAPQAAQAPPATSATTPTAVVTVPGVGVLTGVPVSATEIRALRAKRSELSSQLESAASRRSRLSSSLAGKEGADRAGIEARIGVLDKRIMQLEQDIAETGRQLTMAPAALVASTESRGQFGRMDPDASAALAGIFIIFVLAPIAFSAARMMWKRTLFPPKATTSVEDSRRLERLEQGMDAIAIEIERVSEGQRFVTKLLSEGHGSVALPASQRIPETARVGGEAAESNQRART